MAITGEGQFSYTAKSNGFRVQIAPTIENSIIYISYSQTTILKDAGGVAYRELDESLEDKQCTLAEASAIAPEIVPAITKIADHFNPRNSSRSNL